MIVRHLDATVQIVRQDDHDDLSGRFADRFGGEGLWDPNPRDSVIRACAEHDDGWTEWEDEPEVDPESGRAWNFRDMEIARHLRLYRTGIPRVTGRDPYAGMLVSMHGSGIYRGRYGLQPEMQLSYAPEVESAIDEFVAEQEAAQEELRERLGADRDEVWSAYRLLQAADRFSLSFCLDPEQGRTSLGAAPGAGGEDVEISIEPLGDWRVRLTPFPLASGAEETFSLLRRVLPDRAWGSDEELRAALLEAPVETVEIAVLP